jgi:hypothetical protein
VAFYVPLGPRGLLFRLGTFVIGIWGGLVYRLAYRRREIVMPIPGTFPSFDLGAQMIYTPLEVRPPMASTLLRETILSESDAAALV